MSHLLLDTFRRIKRADAGYPRPFKFLFWGTLANRVGTSMLWPFLTIYMRERLDVPLTTITVLLALHSAAAVVGVSVAGPTVDRFGRKGAMILSLLVAAIVLSVMIVADTITTWGVLLVIQGACTPLYRVGAHAMVADLIEEERRAGAYALLRMVANLGIAVGPAAGGFVTTVSYSLAFVVAAGANFLFALLILFLVSETMPQRRAASTSFALFEAYHRILRNRPFLAFCGLNVLAGIAYSLVMILLPVYAKDNFGIQESQYGFIMSTNAAMVVMFQYHVTRIAGRYHHLPVLAVGSLFYALGVGSVAWGGSFFAFLVSMVILTIGEMLSMPTSTALTANLAPPAMRGRYLSFYALTWEIAYGIGPVVGGVLNDNVAPAAIWYGGLVIGLVAALGFMLLFILLKRRRTYDQSATV